MKCLEKDMSKRYQSVEELQRDLADYLGIKYNEELKTSREPKRSSHYLGELLIINMKIGNIVNAYKYITDLIQYAEGEVKEMAIELSKQLKIRIENNLNEIPEELIKKADFIVHKIKLQFKNII